MIRFYWFFIILSITISGIVTPEVIKAQALQGQPLADSLLMALPKTKEDTAKAKIFPLLPYILAKPGKSPLFIK